MDLSDFQRKAILLIFISILIGSILLARKEPLKEKEIAPKSEALTPQISPIPQKIDINTADISLIMQLPGIGPGLAEEIIKHRPYSDLKDLLNVPGIGEKRLSRIKEMIDLPEGGADVRGHVRGPASAISVPVEPSPAVKIDLNKATIEELSNLPGIGPVLAQAIIDYREKNTRFNTLEELMQVPRIGEKTFEKIKGYLYVEKMAETPNMCEPNMSEDRPRPSPRPSIYDSRIDPKVKCPYCGEKLWEKGRRKQKYIRCPHCLRLLNE